MTTSTPKPENKTVAVVGTVIISILVLGVVIVSGISIAQRPVPGALAGIAFIAALGAFLQFVRYLYDTLRSDKETSLLDTLGWGFVLVAAFGTGVYTLVA